MFTLKLRITCVLLEEPLVGIIHIVDGIGQSELIDLTEPFILSLKFSVAPVIAVSSRE